jgi:DNA-directed RNA polymerase III subunit RPC3
MAGCCSKSKKSQLALSILEEHFGQKVAQVAAYLLSHERNSLIEIAQFFARAPPKDKLKLSAIKEVLLVLLQHQCLVMSRPSTTTTPPSSIVTMTSNEEEAAELYSGLQYGLNLDAILYRLRFPHLVEICGKCYGDLAANIMEEMIQHGRLPMAMVLESVMKRLEEDGSDEYTTQEDVMSVFEKLIQRRFIVPAQTLDVAVIRPLPPLEKGSDILDGIEKAPSGGSSGTKKRKTVEKSASGVTEITTKRSRTSTPAVVSAAVLPSTADEMLPLEIRLMMQKQQQLSAAGDPSASSSKASSNGSTSVSKRGGRGGRGRGRGRREEEPVPHQSSSSPSDHLAPKTSSSSSSSGPRDSVLWTIGWEQLDREERHQLCINVAHQRMGSLAGGIVKIILDRSMPTEMGSKQTHSSPMSLLDLCAILRESKASTGAHSGVDIQTIRQVMDLLRCDALGIVDKITGNSSPPNGDASAASQQSRDSGTQYTVNIAGICRAVGGRLMRNIAEEKFGKESARIVELLQKHKYLEQQKLSEMLILPAREGRERLYELFKHHWVGYLELSKRGDYGAASTSFFWNLDREKLQPSLLESMYGTLLNLRLRKQMEREQGKDVLDFSHTITDREEKLKYQRLCLALNRLDNSIMKVIENTLVLGAW